MKKIRIDLAEFKIFAFYMIMFPFQLIERLFPFMDSGIKILQIIVFLFCIFEIYIKGIPFLNVTEWPIYLFCAWGMISTLVNTPNELTYYIHWTIFPVFSMIVFSKCFYQYGVNKAVKCISRLYEISIWINFLLMLFFPKGIIISNVGATAYRANWLFGSKNNIVSELPSILMFLFYDLFLKRKKGENTFVRYITIGIMLLSFSSMGVEKVEIMGGSTTGIIAILFFLFMYGLGRMHYIGKLRGLLNVQVITVISLILMYVVVLVSQGEIRLVDEVLLILGKDRTFSGRSYVWKEAIESIMEYPFMGIGSMQRIFHVYGYSNSLNTGLYSFWITVVVRYGIIGLLLVIAIFFAIRYRSEFQESAGFYILLAFFLTMIGGLSNPTPWKYIIFMVMSLIIYQKEKDTCGRVANVK